MRRGLWWETASLQGDCDGLEKLGLISPIEEEGENGVPFPSSDFLHCAANAKGL
jgi:hypothetical protein